MARDAISILDGATFLVCDTRGDVDASPDEPQGFFYRETRYVSRWQLTANGEPLTVLSTDHVAYFSVKFFLVPPTGTVNQNPTVSIRSGIADEDKAAQVAEQLVGPALFSGWGVRTMAEGEGDYNPIRYHNGTVWPHDNSLIAHGLARNGYREEAARLALAILEAATFFRHRQIGRAHV